MTQISQQILDRLEADREPDQVGRHLVGAARNRGVRHPAGMLDQRLDSTEGLREREQSRAVADLERSRLTAINVERHHAAEPAHLLGRKVVPWVRGQPRVAHGGHARV